jgi:hypothetical protein
MSGDTKEMACVHVTGGELEATATATFALDPDGPVTHQLDPLRIRLCALCAGWVYGRFHRIETRGTRP